MAPGELAEPIGVRETRLQPLGRGLRRVVDDGRGRPCQHVTGVEQPVDRLRLLRGARDRAQTEERVETAGLEQHIAPERHVPPAADPPGRSAAFEKPELAAPVVAAVGQAALVAGGDRTKDTGRRGIGREGLENGADPGGIHHLVVVHERHERGRGRL